MLTNIITTAFKTMQANAVINAASDTQKIGALFDSINSGHSNHFDINKGRELFIKLYRQCQYHCQALEGTPVVTDNAVYALMLELMPKDRSRNYDYDYNGLLRNMDKFVKIMT